MNPVIEEQYIASLILKEQTVGLISMEQERLKHWRQTDPENEMIYTRLHKNNFRVDLSRYQQIDVQQGWERYRKRYSQKKKRQLSRWYWAASIATLIIGISIFFFYHENHNTAPQAVITPGKSQAILVLNNGNTIDLSEKNNKDIMTSEEVSIRNDGSELQYSVAENTKTDTQTKYNVLIVPKGGEFTLILADGTKVWLNSHSKLKYPVVFNDQTRTVYLEGEAYFEVTKDLEHPFRINAKNNVSIEVLGTSFNVKSYADENTVETVLEEGSVCMSQGKDTVMLSPGYKAIYHSGEPIKTENVNTELYTAWRHGQYIFMDESVENILKQLSRWYDIEVFYSSEAAKSAIFSGDVRKYSDINVLLEAMEIAGGIHFKINGKTLIVSE